MNIKSTDALVPFEGIMLPAYSVTKEIGNHDGRNHHNRIISPQVRNIQLIKNYGKLGKSMESEIILGEMIDIYV